MSKGKVYLVGAGPGDPGLMTLKGYRLLCRADVVLHDHLVPVELLACCKPSAEIIPVGKFAGRHTLPQAQINQMLVEKASNNSIVVRLKGGDPFLFGRGGEEAEACAQAGIDFEVVPGITSALAAPTYAGIPPTHRDYTPSVAIVTGHRREDKQLEIPRAGTIIFLMGVANVRQIITALLDAGWPSTTRIAAIENATCYNQRVITGTLDNFAEVVHRENLRTPAVFIAGTVVELRQKLKWFDTKPTVLFCGLHPERYEHLGNILHRPMIDCVALDDYGPLDTALERLNSFDWIVFTSGNAIKFFFHRLRATGRDARAIVPAKVAVIGAASAERLADFGVAADLCAGVESSAGLLQEFRRLGVRDKAILLPQSQIAGSELSDGLTELGAAVEVVPVYKTIQRDPGEIDFAHIDQILFTSGSTVRAFVEKFGSVPEHIKVFCLGPVTLAEAAKHNIRAELLPGSKAARGSTHDD